MGDPEECGAEGDTARGHTKNLLAAPPPSTSDGSEGGGFGGAEGSAPPPPPPRLWVRYRVGNEIRTVCVADDEAVQLG